MSEFNFGTQQMTDEAALTAARDFERSSTRCADPYQRVWGAAGEPPLPVYEVTFATVASSSVRAGHRTHRRFRRGPALGTRQQRIPTHRAPQRRLPDRTWEITATPGTPAISPGRTALVIARTRPAAPRRAAATRVRSRWSASSFRRPIPDHADAAANGELHDAGRHRRHRTDSSTTSSCATRRTRRLAARVGAPIAAADRSAFNKVDQQPTIRQLYQIAELGKPAGEPTRAPEFMRLLVSADQPRIAGDDLDFRDEIMAQISIGRSDTKRTLTFHIEVTDEGETTGPPAEERRTFRNWRSVGTLSSRTRSSPITAIS